jgi:hypothetical protein
MKWLLIVLGLLVLYNFRTISWYMDAAEMRKKGPGEAIDCVGAWSTCPATCGETGIKTYKITTKPNKDGKNCPFSDLDTKACTGKCN